MKKVENYISKLKLTLDNINAKEVEEIVNVFKKCKKERKNIYVFGNGGSGSTASHMVCDLLKGCSFGKNNRFKIICLNDNIPTLLAYSNDINFNEVFVEQLKNYIEKGDIVLGISGSGNSLNVIKAIDFANSKNCITIGFTGFDGGKLKKICKYSINANVNDMQISEDIHLVILHILYKYLS